ncbi:MAG: hypothetical protein JSW15_08485 [Deltaproteobacteria bacterium]|nr:MAG: hypothetical protein JSW15_08485 [Deltaproteobacteria bacterium]
MKRNFPRRPVAFFISLFLISFSAACDVKSFGIHVGEGPEKKGGPPPHAPAHGYRAKYSYHYYPSTYVYFDVSRKVYFYLEGGAWKMSVSLPDHLRVKLGEHVTIEMDTDKPYTKFEEHKNKYPPGQAKKGKKEKK